MMKEVLIIGIPALVGIIVFVVCFRRRNRIPPASSPPPSPPPGSPAPPTSPTPAPAPRASRRSYGWVWWIIIIIAIVYGGRWAWYETQNVSKTTEVPRVDAPGREMRQKFNLNVNLPAAFDHEKSRQSVAKIIDGTPFVFIAKDGKALFQIGSIPKGDCNLQIDYIFTKSNSGYVSVKINGVEYPNIFLPKEGRGVIPIKKEMIRERSSIFISSDSDIRINRLRLEER